MRLTRGAVCSFLVVLCALPLFGADLTVEATSASGAYVTYAGGDGEDHNGRPAGNCSPPSGALFPLGTSRVTCTDGSFFVTVVDTTPPALSLPPSIRAPQSGPVSWTATASDLVDGSTPVTCEPPSGSSFSAGETAVQCTSTDSRGNRSTGSFTVTIDAEAPPPPPPAEWTLPDITAEATSAAGAIVTFHPGQNGTGDDHNGRPVGASCTPASGSLFPLGVTTVNCTAKDRYDRPMATSFRVTVVDTTAPQVVVPRGFSVVATSASGADVSWSASATDLVDGSVAVTCTPASGSTFPVGTTTVTCEASDSRGNKGFGEFVVEVVTQPPDPDPWNLPDVTAEATGPDGAIVTFDVASSGGDDDENGRPQGVSCSHVSGSQFPLGDTLVRCTSSNRGTATFTVHVVDTTAPALTLPVTISVQAASSAGAVVTFEATATDVVDGSVAVSCTPASGSTFPIGSTNVSCSATDAHANTAGGSFVVHVTDPNASDSTPPVIVSITATPNFLWPPNKSMIDVQLNVAVEDESPWIARIIGVTSNDPAGDDNDWIITGDLTLQLRAERSHPEKERRYTIEVEVVDAVDLRTVGSVVVVVADLRKPQDLLAPGGFVPGTRR